MLNTLRITFFVSILLNLASNSVAAGDVHINQFLGPRAGIKYVYVASDGSRVELVGLKATETSLDVEETTFMPKSLVLAGVPEKTTVTYSLSVSENEITKQFGTAKEVLLRGPFEVSTSEWEISGKAMKSQETSREASWIEVKSTCKIVHARNELIFDKSRFVVTTQCRNSELESAFVRKEKYAKGIGMVERTLEAISKQGQVAEIYRITLQEIINGVKVERR